MKLQFSDEAAWYAPIIRWYSHSEYCHVDIVADDGTLIGARPFGGVARRPANYAAFKRTRVVTVPLPNETAATAFLDAQMGRPYDFTSFGGFIFGRDWRDESRWFCSELAAAVLHAGGAFPNPLVLPAHKITPGDLLLILSALLPISVDSQR